MSRQPAPHDPFPLTLDAALECIDQVLGIAAMMADQGHDRVSTYYAQSRIGYDRLHSGKGCMHVALNPDGNFDRTGFLAQPRAALSQMRKLGARRVLDLGAGLGFNARYLARKCPDAEIVALDLLPVHVAEITRRAGTEGLPNLRAVQGSFDALPDDLGEFEVILAVETLCYATDPALVAKGISRHLAPGGCFIMFDPLAARPKSGLSPQMALATQLYGLGVVLTRGLWRPDDWHAALQGAGLTLRGDIDLTAQSLPGLRLLLDRVLLMTASRAGRLALRAMPRYLARNAATALLGPFVCFGEEPAPDAARGSVTYRRLVAERPPV